MFNKDLIESLQKELADVSREKHSLATQYEEAQNTIESFADVKFNYERTIKDLQAKYNEEKANIDKNINRRVNAQLASIGVGTFAIENLIGESQSTTDIEALHKFNALSGQEKTDFYNKNKDKITRALLKKTG
jgi:hypothetical protein